MTSHIAYTIVTDDGLAPDDWPMEHGTYLNAIYLAGDDDVQTALDAISHAQTHATPSVVITFGGTHDGRGFSLARQLREAGFTGHIRAKGPLITDQWRHLRQTGFNSLMLTPEQLEKMPQAAWQDVLNLALPNYQKRVIGH